MKRIARVYLAVVLLALPLGAVAQKRPLRQADWDRWRSVGAASLSADGKWVAYTQNPRVGDGDFVVRSTTGTTEYHVNLGYTNRENNTPGGERGRAGGGGGGGGRGGRGGGGGGAAGPFSADAKYAFVMVSALPKVQVDSAERANAGRGRAGRAGGGGAAGGANTPSSLRIIRLADGNIETVAGARSFRIPEASSKWLVYSPGANASDPDSTAAGGQGTGRAGRGGQGGGGGGGAGIGGVTRRTYGSAIVLRNLDTGAEERLSDVASYTFDDSAKVLAYTVTSRDSTKDGVFIRDLNAGTTKTVLSGPGNYRGFTFDRTQQQFVFATDREDFGKPEARLTVYHGTVRTGTAQPVLNSTALPTNMRFPDNFAANFTRAGNAITVSIAPPAEEAVPADSLTGKARFDLWHWKDKQIQPTQLVQVNQARNRTYQALLNLSTKKLTQITTEEFPNLSLSDDARVGLASTSVAYALESTWGAGGNDVNVVDPVAGTRKEIAKKITGQAQLSVGSKYVLYYDNTHWFAHNIATGKTVDITAPVTGVHFEQETFSRPDDPSAWGVAGWTRDDRSVLVYDRFDIWELDPNGVRPAVVLTDSLGRRENMTLRLINLDNDEDERYVDTSKPLWLSAFDEDSKESGFYRGRLDARRSPEKVVMAPVRFGNPTKAKNADVYMATKSTFVDFPNLYVGPNLASLNTKVSDANPWQSEYSWGTAELVEWLSDDGIPRQGVLYKPDNFDPTKKYPMITYFYEDLSDGLYSYIAPNGGTSVNITHYVSNGYLMFEPDIHYEMGHPGASAMKSILPGVHKLIERGYVDPKRLGLQGHSWGGYQIAYMITQTGLFAAAEAGAPVSNMTSAYGGIRWESGINRAGQYETGQSRIGKSIWEGLPLYLENSPLFSLDRVKTPLLILHNDLDGAVPWYQGIELYIGMRRLGKEAYLFNYNNELHGISGRANQKDWAMRMQQFFDAKLKGTPPPDWMVNGIPAKDKGKDVLKKVVTTTN
ncbi:MAG: prolyl oligopeptidase family serine peptidase [Gemmatimonadota bacterium]